MAGDDDALRAVQLLVKAGADRSIRNANGDTAAELAIRVGRNDKIVAALAARPMA